MLRRLALLAVTCLGFLAVAAAPASAASGGPNPPPKCFVAKNLDLPTCTYDGHGWTVSYPSDSGFGDPGGDGGGGGGIPSGLVALFVLVPLIGIGVTIWRVSMARKMAQDAGMDPNQATAVTLLGNDGLDAAYLAANLRHQQTSVSPVAAAPPQRSASERLAELQQLKDHGQITAEEYDTRRTAIVESV
jgi:hypothetical protein